MKQYKTLIIYTISNDQSKKSFEEELPATFMLKPALTAALFAALIDILQSI